MAISMRIVSLLPGATEMVCALGLREQLIAVSHECDYPADVKNLPQVSSTLLSPALEAAAIDLQVRQAARDGGTLNELNHPLLAQLQPEVIITQSLCDVCAIDQVAVLRAPVGDSDMRLICLSGIDFAGVCGDIQRLADGLGVPETGHQLCRNLQQSWHQMLPTIKTNPRVLFVEWSDPAYYAGHWVPEMITQSGGTDVLGVNGQKSGTFDWRQLDDTHIDVIVFGCCGFGLQRNVTLARHFSNSESGQRLLSQPGVQLWAVDSNSYFSRPGPRLVEGRQIIGALLRGEETDGASARVTVHR